MGATGRICKPYTVQYREDAPLAVIDLAERTHAAVLRGDFEGRERVREEFGLSG